MLPTPVQLATSAKEGCAASNASHCSCTAWQRWLHGRAGKGMGRAGAPGTDAARTVVSQRV